MADMTDTNLTTDSVRASSHDQTLRAKAQGVHLAKDIFDQHAEASTAERQHRFLAFQRAYNTVSPHAGETPTAYQARVRKQVDSSVAPDAYFQINHLQLRHETLPTTHTALQSSLQNEGAALRYLNITPAQVNAHQLQCFRADLITPFPLPADSHEVLAAEMRVNAGFDVASVLVKNVVRYGRAEEDPAQPLVRSGDQQWLEGRSLVAFVEDDDDKHATAGKGRIADSVEDSVFAWRVELIWRTIASVPHLVSIFVRPTGLPDASSLTLSLQHQRLA